MPKKAQEAQLSRATEPVRGALPLGHMEESCLVCIWDREVQKGTRQKLTHQPRGDRSSFLGSSGPKNLRGTSGGRKRENFGLLSQ